MASVDFESYSLKNLSANGKRFEELNAKQVHGIFFARSKKLA